MSNDINWFIGTGVQFVLRDCRVREKRQASVQRSALVTHRWHIEAIFMSAWVCCILQRSYDIQENACCPALVHWTFAWLSASLWTASSSVRQSAHLSISISTMGNKASLVVGMWCRYGAMTYRWRITPILCMNVVVSACYTLPIRYSRVSVYFAPSTRYSGHFFSCPSLSDFVCHD